MRSILDQLADEELLLMYLAEELSSSDRAQVQLRLDSEPDLHSQLERLQAAYAAVNGALESEDGFTPLSGQGAAQRNASIAITRWATQQKATARIYPVKSGLPWWAWACSAAASVLIALLIWHTLPSANDSTADSTPALVIAVAPSDDMAAISDLNATERELDNITYLRTLTE